MGKFGSVLLTRGCDWWVTAQLNLLPQLIPPMSTMSASAPASGSKAIATSALRKAGLIDRDAQMRDDTPGGRKRKLRSGKATRIMEIDGPIGSRSVIILLIFVSIS